MFFFNKFKCHDKSFVITPAFTFSENSFIPDLQRQCFLPQGMCK